jgi:hypothetical protein
VGAPPGTLRYCPEQPSAPLAALFSALRANTELQIDQDEAEDLMSRIQEEVRNRRFAEVVRIEVHPSTPASLRTLLLAEFNAEQDPPTTELSTADVYEVPGLLDVADLMSLSTLDLPALKDPPFHPATPARLATNRNIFEVIAEGICLSITPRELHDDGGAVHSAGGRRSGCPRVVTLYRPAGIPAGAPGLHAAEASRPSDRCRPASTRRTTSAGPSVSRTWEST